MKVGTRRIEAIDGEALHHLVLVVRDLRLAVVAHPGEEVAREVEAVGRAKELVVRGVERDLDVVAEDLLAAVDVDGVVDHAPDGVAHRRQRAADVQEVVAERRRSERASHRRAGSRRDPRDRRSGHPVRRRARGTARRSRRSTGTASIPTGSSGFVAFMTVSMSHAGKPFAGVLRTVSNVSCVTTMSISW